MQVHCAELVLTWLKVLTLQMEWHAEHLLDLRCNSPATSEHDEGESQDHCFLCYKIKDAFPFLAFICHLVERHSFLSWASNVDLTSTTLLAIAYSFVNCCLASLTETQFSIKSLFIQSWAWKFFQELIQQFRQFWRSQWTPGRLRLTICWEHSKQSIQILSLAYQHQPLESPLPKMEFQKQHCPMQPWNCASVSLLRNQLADILWKQATIKMQANLISSFRDSQTTRWNESLFAPSGNTSASIKSET